MKDKFKYHAIFSISLIIFCILLDLPLLAQDQKTNWEKLDADAIFQEYKSTLAQAQQSSDPYEKAVAHLQIARFYQDAQIFTEAIDHYNQALGSNNLLAKDTLSVQINNCLGTIYLVLGKLDQAKDFFEEAIQVADAINYPKGMAQAKSSLGACYEKKSDYLRALSLEKESLQLFERLQDLEGIALVQENIGSIYEDLLQYDRAHEYFFEAYQYFKGSSSEPEIKLLNNLGDIFRKQGDLQQALPYTQEALALAEKINNKDQMESAHKDLSKTYALAKKFELAYQHLLDAQVYEDLLQQEQSSAQINRLQTIYDFNKKEAQIQLLQQQNKANRANQRLILLVLVVLIFSLLVYFNYHSRKKALQLKVQEYEGRTLQAELAQKAIEEQNLQHEIQLKTAALSNYSLHIAQKNKILLDLSTSLKHLAEKRDINFNKKIKALAKSIDLGLQQENEWEEFIRFFKEIHPHFVKKLAGTAEEKLSPAELRLGVLLRLNLSSKEIASILRITPDSVRVARHRLRKKLPIQGKEDLTSFMIGL